MKISLGMIVRNEGRTLEKCLSSVAPHVDEIVIGLAGESTDDTEAIARKFTDNIINIPWHDDFSEARNIVWGSLTGDYGLWLDGDDELIGGEKMRSIIVENPETDAFYWGYDYAQDPDSGASVCFLVRERLARMDAGFQWVGAIHEILIGPPDHSKKFVNDILVVHHKPANKHDDRRNLQVLYKQLETGEPNPDPRILAYLGSENFTRGNVAEAILHWQRYITLSDWDEEKYQVTHRLADAHRILGDYSKSLSYDFAATGIIPEWPDAYLGIAETNYHMGRWQACIEWMKAASTKHKPETMLIINPRDYDYTPLMILALAYTQIGDYQMSLENALRAYEINPNKELLTHINLVREEIAAQELTEAVKTVWAHLGRNDEWLKARRLWDAVPKLVEQDPEINDMRAKTMEWTAHVEDPQLMIDAYVNNPHWEPMKDEDILDPGWINYPRLAFALKVIQDQKARNLVDFGCSDGFITLPIAQRLPKLSITGIDLDPRCIQLATQRTAQWSVPLAAFITGNASEWRSDVERFYDVGLAFEIIEHVVDPNEFLANLEHSAKHIAITTPHLAWENGNAPGWDQPDLKGHLHIFDLDDVERMLAPRGRIYNLYHQPWGNSGWIFADYRVGERASGNITIAAMGAPEEWSPRELNESGFGGSETAIIRLSEEFSRAGKAVTVFSRTDGTNYFNGVRYRHEERFLPAVHSDLFVAWRSPELIDLAPNSSYRVLWLHDTDRGESLTEERANQFDAIVALTEWHKQHLLETYPFLDAGDIHVVGNGVDVARFEQPVERDPNRVIYSSSPDRGLDLILEHIWPKVVEVNPKAELHIYYGWEVYDKFLHIPGMREYKAKIMELLSHSKNVVLHGRVGQDELAEAFQKATVWLYPTYFSETYCITAVEAQLAGAIPVTNRLAALAETVRSGMIIEGDVRDPIVLQQYISAVTSILDLDNDHRQALHEEVKRNAPQLNWSDVADLWLEDFMNDRSDDSTHDLLVLSEMRTGRRDTRSEASHAVPSVPEVRGTDDSDGAEGDAS